MRILRLKIARMLHKDRSQRPELHAVLLFGRRGCYGEPATPSRSHGALLTQPDRQRGRARTLKSHRLIIILTEQDTEKPFFPLSIYSYTNLYAVKNIAPFREVY